MLSADEMKIKWGALKGAPEYQGYPADEVAYIVAVRGNTDYRVQVNKHVNEKSIEDCLNVGSTRPDRHIIMCRGLIPKEWGRKLVDLGYDLYYIEKLPDISYTTVVVNETESVYRISIRKDNGSDCMIVKLNELVK